MMRYFFILFLVLGIAACTMEVEEQADAKTIEKEEKPDRSQQLIQEAIKAHGSEKVSGSRIEFDFRDRHYVSERDGGQFHYERIFADSTGEKVRDILSNEGFVREVEGQVVALPEERIKAFSNSVNSVLYFGLLPYYLNDPAVQKEYIGEGVIKGAPYHKVKVTFQQEGGGKDFEDVFVYWFHRDNKTMDFLAYNYQTDGGGARFREAFNIREIGGIRFADFINYKPVEERMDVENFDQLYEAGKMQELSRIKTENPRVSVLDQ